MSNFLQLGQIMSRLFYIMWEKEAEFIGVPGCLGMPDYTLLPARKEEGIRNIFLNSYTILTVFIRK